MFSSSSMSAVINISPFPVVTLPPTQICPSKISLREGVSPKNVFVCICVFYNLSTRCYWAACALSGFKASHILLTKKTDFLPNITAQTCIFKGEWNVSASEGVIWADDDQGY